MAEKQKIRIRLKAYDHEVIDQSTKKIVETVLRTQATVRGPIPLPTENHRYTVIRGPAQGQGQPRALRDADPQAPARHPRAVAEDRRLAAAHRAARRRRHRDQDPAGLDARWTARREDRPSGRSSSCPGFDRTPRRNPTAGWHPAPMIKVGLQIPNFTYPDTDAGGPLREGGRRGRRRRGGRRRHRHGDGPLLPAGHDGPARARDVRGLHAARRAGRPHEDGQARHARHRRHLPQPGDPRQDRHHARRDLAAGGPSSASARRGSTSSTTRSASTSRP